MFAWFHYGFSRVFIRQHLQGNGRDGNEGGRGGLIQVVDSKSFSIVALLF